MMPDWLDSWLSTRGELLQWAVLLSLGLLVVGSLLLPVVVLRIPPGYFSSPEAPGHSPVRNRTPLALAAAAVRNLAGGLLVLTGVAMLFVPGQGLLAIAVGLALMDFPGKPKVLRRLVLRRRILSSINRFRRRFGRPPLEAPAEAPPAPGPGR